MLASALRRHTGHRAFDQLEQGLLHALTRHITGDRRVVGLARDLVDLVDVDNAPLRTLDIVVAALQQLEHDVFDVFADIAGLGQRGGIGHHERHIEHARQRLCQQGLARAGRTDQQDVALGQFDIVLLGFFLVPQALVVVVDGNRQRALGRFLPNHVVVEIGLDLRRCRQFALGVLGDCACRQFVANDLVAQLDAFVADKHRRTGNQLLHLVLALAAEGAIKRFLAGCAFFLGHEINTFWGDVAMIPKYQRRTAAARPKPGQCLERASGPQERLLMTWSTTPYSLASSADM